MLMNAGAVRGVAGDLRRSAAVVNDAAVRIADCRRDFDAADAGREYHVAGARLSYGFDDVPRYLFCWANCLRDCAGALQASVDSCAETDQATANDLGAVAGGFA